MHCPEEEQVIWLQKVVIVFLCVVIVYVLSVAPFHFKKSTMPCIALKKSRWFDCRKLSLSFCCFCHCVWSWCSSSSLRGAPCRALPWRRAGDLTAESCHCFFYLCCHCVCSEFSSFALRRAPCRALPWRRAGDLTAESCHCFFMCCHCVCS